MPDEAMTDTAADVIETNGVKIPFDPRVITPKIERPMRNNRYEGGECAALRQYLRPGDRVLELGAGIGLLSTVAATTNGVEAVTTVEANPELIPVIKATHDLNDARNVTVLNGVVSNGASGNLDFFLRPDFWASSMEPDSRAYKKVVSVPAHDIHTLIDERSPTVIVCDIEGAELGLFDDADLSCVRVMILEFHPKVYGDMKTHAIYGMLADKGLHIVPVDKPSTVRTFLRQPISAEPAHTVKAGKPDLTGLPDKPWSPETARYLVTTCMKDEGPFILEWLAWHKAIGIQDFVIFTNDCSDGTGAILDRLEEMGQLRHMPNPALSVGSPHFQPIALAYTPFLPEFEKADFYISMDVDEFINIRAGQGRMADLLQATGPFDALSMSELNHGSNFKEDFEPGLVMEQFPRHQREAPGKFRSRRGVKTLTRLGSRLKHIRNHRPDLAGDVTWLDGSGRALASLHEDPKENGIDVRGTYELVSLDHFALRSIGSFLIKMARGDVVVEGKSVSPRYWRMRDRDSDLTSTFERQWPLFEPIYQGYMADPVLRDLHDESCAYHTKRIADLMTLPDFRDRRDWIVDTIWTAKREAAKAT